MACGTDAWSSLAVGSGSKNGKQLAVNCVESEDLRDQHD